ncbi:DNA repair exonuclease SbcCD ATPase subunit [Geosmithia morbida]|uniref:DNA repair exonuclease SbcCD ATPase subunit n=1 Tax=Geosmithia morbida TaxID=1094350 RepID=A0A9P4Z210_9HYPO|nr:DNA repair exonuclease SbcCD ATPase subunit [Geosmithia morbida]KAF4126235.1 DNA repair exonuclease SbcCD ATPase subunit [Geosmithia morbida]
MASHDLDLGRTDSSPLLRPMTAQRVSAEDVHTTATTFDAAATVTMSTTPPDRESMMDHASFSRERNQQHQYHQQIHHDDQPDHDDSVATAEAASTADDHPDTSHIDSSSFEAAPMDPSRGPDESVSEDVVREHFKDVESSFLSTLSPILTVSNSAGGGADDTYVFDSPNKADMQQTHRAPQDQEPESTTNIVERLDSSPTAAATARTVSRALGMASGANNNSNNNNNSSISSNDNNNNDNKSSTTDCDPAKAAAAHTPLIKSSSHQSASVESFSEVEDEVRPGFDDSTGGGDDEGLLWSQSYPNRQDGASTAGSNTIRGKRPRYLRSRYGSQRSSTSSFTTNPESHDGSDVTTLGHGADYALQSGGAVPTALGASSRPASGSVNMLARTVSMGSVASGFDDSLGQLETLPEVASPTREQTPLFEDVARTPKPSRENLNTAPTDTVIAQHVKNVHVPESLAREYKFENNLETPRNNRSSYATTTGSGTTTGRAGKSLTLKEQSSTIERLSKENFDLKLKVMFLSDRLDKLSEEGIKEMISENVDLKTGLAVFQRDNKVLRRRIKELERQQRDDDERPSTARSGASSTDQTARMYDEEAQEKEEELVFLRERVEEYATEIERLRTDNTNSEAEKRRMSDMLRSSMTADRAGESVGRQEEADVWKDLLEQETARREQADEDNRRLREELFRIKHEVSGSGSALHHTTNIYNISKKQRERGNMSPNRPFSVLSGEVDNGSNANLSAASTLVDELRREAEQLRHENAELRREVGAQTSMLTSRNREKERLYQEIEDLKMSARHGRGAPSTAADSILERSASQVGGHGRSRSRGSAHTLRTTAEEEEAEREREELETKLAELRDNISEVKLQNQELQRELETCMEDFETAVNGKREAEEQVLSLQEDLQTAMNDLVALQSERDDALREQADMENEFEALRQEAQNEIDALEAEADQRGDEMQRLQADLADRSENFDALQEEMRKLSDALIGLEDEQLRKLRRIGEVEQELESSNRELEELESKLREANEKNQRMTVQHESAQDEIGFLREEQEADKIRIGDLEASLANVEQSLREEKDRSRELEQRLSSEREQREAVANKEKEDVQQIVNQLNKEASTAKDESRRLRKSLSSREVEAAEWKERLTELENNLREALGDLNGTRSSLLKSIAKMQRELEDTVRELDSTRASVVEKDRIIKQRDALLESHGLESRKLSELLDKERLNHRNTKSQFEAFEKHHQHLSRTASTQDGRIMELEAVRNQERQRLYRLEQQSREQLAERNELLLTLWQKLSGLCGREWANNNTIIDRQVLPSLEVVATRLPGFSKNLLGAVKAIETIVGSFQTKIKAVDRELSREYQTLESNLEVRTKKLDRLETMVRNTVASNNSSSELHSRMLRMEDKYRQLKVEHATLKAAKDARARAAAYASPSTLGVAPGVDDGGSPSPFIPRGPLDRTGHGGRSSSIMSRKTSSSHGTDGPEMATLAAVHATNENEASGGGGGGNNDNRWLLRLREMEYKLKMEREARNQDRQAARTRLGGLESENRDLRERVKRWGGDEY